MEVWLRPLIPYWRFFANVGSIPKLYARSLNEGSSAKWQPVLQMPARKWYSILINADVNLHHAYCNALEHLMHHPADEDALRIIDRLVRRHFMSERCDTKPLRYQFKVVVLNFRNGQVSEEDQLQGEGEL